ncbi:MAG: class I SAM-dependent methyltransferase [Candidatus Nealsonbacteria bacterium]|nr:class I SAM-dependent methyltransferase [Candidatus Nealsonbacteria bacterium]
MPEGPPDWDERYQQGHIPWNSGHPSEELQRILAEREIARGRVLELGCGTGTNAVFLAEQGFDVTAMDLSSLAAEQARAKAAAAGVDVTFLAADLLELPDLLTEQGVAPFPFVFDRGVYHTVRRSDVSGFVETLSRVTDSGGIYLTLAGNANEVRPGEEGPPRVSAKEICHELCPPMELIQLREIRFYGTIVDGKRECPLAWSALFRRK